MECVIANGIPCSSPLLEGDYFCLLKYKEVEGFTDTNAHVSDCSDTFYEKSICCSGEGGGGECIEEANPCVSDNECCDISQGYDFDQHCSYGQYEDLIEGYCCEIGEYWYQPIVGPGYCRSADPCYNPDVPSECNYILSQNPTSYFNDPDCIISSPLGYYEACCNKNWYGTTGEYFYCPIEAI